MILVRFFTSLVNILPSIKLSSLAYMQTPTATLITDRAGIILKVNYAFETLTGYKRSEVLGENISFLRSSRHTDHTYIPFWQKLMKTELHDCQIYTCHKDKTVLLMREKAVPITSCIRPHFLVTLEDITEQKKQIETYLHMATHDPLTGLGNRTLLDDRFSHACSNAIRRGEKVGLLICDLNDFKQCNDIYGHNFGDTVLKKVAETLKETVRVNDTVVRYGGDEFMLVLEQIKDPNDILKIINELENAFPILFEVNGQTHEVNISIGHACFPNEGTTFDQLVYLADTKMYLDKGDTYAT